VLDLPCGVGRHTAAFAARGYEATAVDRTQGHLDTARARLSRDGLAAELLAGDMRTFVRPDAFDLVVNLFTSFGYFEDPDEDAAVLEHFFASLRPGGALVMELLGKEVLAGVFRPRDWFETADGVKVLEERTLSRDWSWIHVRWTVIKDGQERSFDVEHRLYGASDLVRVVSRAGFAEIRCYGGLDGSPYDHQAKRLALVATKPDVG
jgi:SAM-dependent methyltransferase